MSVGVKVGGGERGAERVDGEGGAAVAMVDDGGAELDGAPPVAFTWCSHGERARRRECARCGSERDAGASAVRAAPHARARASSKERAKS